VSVELPQRLAEPEPPPRPAKAGWRKRLWIYVVTLSAGVAATLAYFDASPESRLAGLLAAVDASAGRKRVFQNDGGYLAVFPQRGYVLTLFVGDSQRFDPVQYMTLRRVDDEVSVELIIPSSATSGSETSLRGAELQRFLTRVGISQRGVERTLERNYTATLVAPGG